jgi:hypothetical protein
LQQHDCPKTPRPQLSSLARTAAAEPVLGLLNAGRLVLFAGERPHDPDTPAPVQHGLVQLRFGQPAFGTLVSGLAEANPITPGTAEASGEASWFRCFAADGQTAVLDGSIGTDPETADLTLNSVLIEAGATVSIAGFTYVQAG